MLNYLKTAFLNRWNLLAFFGAAAFAWISGAPDVLLPIVLAGELTYVGLLGSHPKFQSYVDAQAAQATRADAAQDDQAALARILRSLPRESLQRFQSLRTQCLELRQIAVALKRPGGNVVDLPLDDLQVTGLDRLLWIYLRLLYTQYALSQFLQKTTANQIQGTIDKLEQQLNDFAADEKEPGRQRVRAALHDNLETSRCRLANWSKANENHQFIALELDRLENKIRSLCEMAVNRQEPEFITSEVDHVASSLLDTERTMNELQFATGLSNAASEPPSLLRVKAELVQNG